MPHEKEIGRSRLRLEDERFLTGKGRYVDDVDEASQLYGHVVRSPFGHARIAHIDASAAAAMPGVAAVFTAAELSARGLGHLPCMAKVATLEPLIVPPRPALADGRVRHVGDPVAFVVATSRVAARDAAESVGVDYEELPAASASAPSTTAGSSS